MVVFKFSIRYMRAIVKFPYRRTEWRGNQYATRQLIVNYPAFGGRKAYPRVLETDAGTL